MYDLNGKIILVTGGTGSFGKKFVEIVLKKYKPKKLIIFSRDEQKQYEMAKQFPNEDPMRYFIGDVRDVNRLRQAFQKVDIVIHAAAMKHVPIAEYNPIECIKTNIHGAENIVTCAIEDNVDKVIALSTDKAANPINLYGATKLCSDKIFVASNAYTAFTRTRFSVVRYGNVLGSSGSVIPFFLEKRGTGVLPITDMKMTRFWITLEQAVEFVLKCLTRMEGTEVFVPKIPSMKIADLAKVIGPDCELKEVGIRPGEKLHETMVPVDDSPNTVEFDDYYVILPQFDFSPRRSRDQLLAAGGRPLSDRFSYSSDTNPQWLTEDELKKILKAEKFI